MLLRAAELREDHKELDRTRHTGQGPSKPYAYRLVEPTMRLVPACVTQ